VGSDVSEGEDMTRLAVGRRDGRRGLGRPVAYWAEEESGPWGKKRGGVATQATTRRREWRVR